MDNAQTCTHNKITHMLWVCESKSGSARGPAHNRRNVHAPVIFIWVSRYIEICVIKWIAVGPGTVQTFARMLHALQCTEVLFAKIRRPAVKSGVSQKSGAERSLNC